MRTWNSARRSQFLEGIITQYYQRDSSGSGKCAGYVNRKLSHPRMHRNLDEALLSKS